MPKRQRASRVGELLSKVGLTAHAERYPAQLSGGMQQRLQIARCLAQEPSILLMDEPFGALDAITRHGLQDEVAALVAATGVTVMFVTHDLEEAIYLGDRVISLKSNPVVWRRISTCRWRGRATSFRPARTRTSCVFAICCSASFRRCCSEDTRARLGGAAGVARRRGSDHAGERHPQRRSGPSQRHCRCRLDGADRRHHRRAERPDPGRGGGRDRHRRRPRAGRWLVARPVAHRRAPVGGLRRVVPAHSVGGADSDRATRLRLRLPHGDRDCLLRLLLADVDPLPGGGGGGRTPPARSGAHPRHGAAAANRQDRSAGIFAAGIRGVPPRGRHRHGGGGHGGDRRQSAPALVTA